MDFAKFLCKLLITSAFVVSCAAIKHDSIRIVNKLEKEDFKQLNGQYTNNPNDGSGKLLRSQYNGEYQLKSLWANIDSYQIGSSSDWKTQSVDIEFLTPKKAIFRLNKGDSLIDKKTVRGKFKDGYFYERPFLVIFPLVPVLFGHNTNRLRIGKVENGLVADYKWNTWMFFLIAGQSEKGESSLIFSKK
jgi:hypothetical protein